MLFEELIKSLAIVDGKSDTDKALREYVDTLDVMPMEGHSILYSVLNFVAYEAVNAGAEFGGEDMYKWRVLDSNGNYLHLGDIFQVNGTDQTCVVDGLSASGVYPKCSSNKTVPYDECTKLVSDTWQGLISELKAYLSHSRNCQSEDEVDSVISNIVGRARWLTQRDLEDVGVL